MKYRVVAINYPTVLIQEILTEKIKSAHINDFAGTLIKGIVVEEKHGLYVTKGNFNDSDCVGGACPVK